MAILSLTEYKKRRSLNEASKERDEATEAAIVSAEDAILKYTDRDFNDAQNVETRTYVYDGSGILETDDFVELTGVSVEGAALTTLNFHPGPRTGETFYWIDFTGVPRQSPLMGFTRNEDRIFDQRVGVPGPRYVNVQVTAKFGWPGGAPASVVQAAVWLVDEFRKSQGTQGEIQAEGIADLSFVYQRINEESKLPARIMALLEPYRRIAL
jgi:hypothetical protein